MSPSCHGHKGQAMGWGWQIPRKASAHPPQAEPPPREARERKNDGGAREEQDYRADLVFSQGAGSYLLGEPGRGRTCLGCWGRGHTCLCISMFKP